MKGLLKNLGLILILVGAVILVACSFYRQCKQQRDSGHTSAVLIVIGLISYILINKRIAD